MLSVLVLKSVNQNKFI